MKSKKPKKFETGGAVVLTTTVVVARKLAYESAGGDLVAVKSVVKAKKCPCPECSSGIHKTLPSVREVSAVIDDTGELIELKSTRLKTAYACPHCKCLHEKPEEAAVCCEEEVVWEEVDGGKKEKIIVAESM